MPSFSCVNSIFNLPYIRDSIIRSTGLMDNVLKKFQYTSYQEEMIYNNDILKNITICLRSSILFYLLNLLERQYGRVIIYIIRNIALLKRNCMHVRCPFMTMYSGSV